MDTEAEVEVAVNAAEVSGEEVEGDSEAEREAEASFACECAASEVMRSLSGVPSDCCELSRFGEVGLCSAGEAASGAGDEVRDMVKVEGKAIQTPLRSAWHPCPRLSIGASTSVHDDDHLQTRRASLEHCLVLAEAG